MADYGIVMTIKDIKGNCALEGYKDGILVQRCSFSSTSERKGKIVTRTVQVDQGPISLEIAAGRWVAELQDACYNRKNVGEIVIAQLGQAVDKNAKAAPTVLQKLKLTNAVVVSVEQHWDTGDGARMAGITLMFEKILFEIGSKPADFTLKNFTAGAI